MAAWLLSSNVNGVREAARDTSSKNIQPDFLLSIYKSRSGLAVTTSTEDCRLG